MNKTIIDKKTCSLFQASWADINFLYDHKWINCEEIKKYADDSLLKNSNDYLNNLLWSQNNTFDFSENLKELAKFELPDFGKLSSICLYDILQSEKQFKETQDLIEELYCDLSHLESLAQFVSYMPVEKDEDFFLEKNYKLKIQEFLQKNCNLADKNFNK